MSGAVELAATIFVRNLFWTLLKGHDVMDKNILSELSENGIDSPAKSMIEEVLKLYIVINRLLCESVEVRICWFRGRIAKYSHFVKFGVTVIVCAKLRLAVATENIGFPLGSISTRSLM